MASSRVLPCPDILAQAIVAGHLQTWRPVPCTRVYSIPRYSICVEQLKAARVPSASAYFLKPRLIFLVTATYHDLEGLVRQGSSQRLRLIPLRSHTSVVRTTGIVLGRIGST